MEWLVEALRTMTAPGVLPALTGLAGVVIGCLLQWFISGRQIKAAFRMAALDKRLKTHQKAFRLWHEMVWALHDPQKRPETAARCQEWWINHCLYLDAKSRKEFLQCAREAGQYEMLKDPNNQPETKARFKRINDVFKLLEEGVYLPSIGGLEKPPVQTSKESL